MIDANGDNVVWLYYDLVSGQTSAPVVLTVTAAPGMTFQSGSHAAVIMKARVHSSGDPYTSLVDGIDLDPMTPGPVEFDVVCEAQTIMGRVRAVVFIGVVSEELPAGWAV